MRQKFEYKDFEGNTQTISIKPLPVRYLGDYFEFLKKFQNAKYDESKSEEENNKIFFDTLDKGLIDKLAEMSVESIRKSTGWDKEATDEFVSEHFFEFFPIMIQANMPFKDE